MICTFKTCECYIRKASWLSCVLLTPPASENGKINPIPCAQSKSVIDSNHLVIIIFSLVIKKKKSTIN